jgi:hypothetical protein
MQCSTSEVENFVGPFGTKNMHLLCLLNRYIFLDTSSYLELEERESLQFASYFVVQHLICAS